MIRNLTVIECMVGERAYRLMCENDSPLLEVKEALSKFIAHVVKIEESHEKAKADAEKAKLEEEAQKEKVNDNQQ